MDARMRVRGLRLRVRLLSVKQRIALLAVIVAALALPAVALAWSQYYVSHTYFNPDGIGLSSFNSNLNYNEISWNADGVDVMQSTLCDSSYSCYAYQNDTSGFDQDYRSISYGRAKCHAYSGNMYSVYIYDCYTQN